MSIEEIIILQDELAEAQAEIERLKGILGRCKWVFERISYKKQTASLRAEIQQALKEQK